MSTTALSWTISLGLAGAGAIAFLLVTLVTGDYDWVARLGGSAWVFLLAVIILLPTVMPALRERAGRAIAGTVDQGALPLGMTSASAGAAKEVSAMAKDPVCGMEVDPDNAAGSSEYMGQTYYFCSVSCKKSFDENPEQYVAV